MSFYLYRRLTIGFFILIIMGATLSAQAQDLDVNATFLPSTAVTGDSVTFFWDGSPNASRCSVTGVPGLTTFQPFGSFTFTAAQSLNATVNCAGAINGRRASGSDSATLTVLDNSTPPTVNASFNPTAIVIGQSTTFSWSSSNASSCSSTGGVSISGTSGSTSVSPSNSITVTVTCTGPGGSSSASASVSVDTNPPPPPPSVSAFFSPSFINAGQFSTLFWFASNAQICSGFGFVGGPSGSAFLGPYFFSTVESVICTGPGGTGVGNAFISVFFGPQTRDQTAGEQLTADQRQQLGLRSDTRLRVIAQDFDADGQQDQLLYLPDQQQLLLRLRDENGDFRLTKALYPIENLEQIQQILVQTDLNGNTTVQVVTSQ